MIWRYIISAWIGAIVALAIAHSAQSTKPATKRPVYRYKIQLTDTNGWIIECPVLDKDMDYLRTQGRLEIVDIKFTGLE